MSWKRLFTRFHEADRLHFAAHSHHYWPDVTEPAQRQAWDDAARLADAKWDRVFDVVIPEMQQHVARRLGLPRPETVTVAPNTHELVTRLVSCLPAPASVVTTDGEFHSFDRQLRRWEEAGRVTVRRVPVEPFATFGDRLIEAVTPGDDLVYLSHVFFDSGFVVPDLDRTVAALPVGPTVVLDGYHGFMAVPTDLGHVADRAFYVAGGYKYAMAGEGACFMHCPPGVASRPVDTGWFAGFGALASERSDSVPYAPDGRRFLGATFDPTGLYRFNAVQRMLDDEGLDVAAIHGHVSRLQARLVDRLGDIRARPGELIPPWGTGEDVRGHFLTFRSRRAGDMQRTLLDRGVVTDRRGDRLRIGFALYHDDDDVDRLAGHLIELPPTTTEVR